MKIIAKIKENSEIKYINTNLLLKMFFEVNKDHYLCCKIQNFLTLFH